MADGQTALASERREPERAVEVSVEELGCAPLLPGCETTTVCRRDVERRSICMGDVSAQEKTEGVEEEVRGGLWRIQ